MFDRERAEALMLDSLYGLLDAAESAELDGYLAAHPEGETLRQHAEEWQQQLGLAAKSDFPSVQFAPPTPGAKPQPAKTATVRQAKPVAKPAKKAGWALAGSALLVVLGFGIPAGIQFVGHWNKASEVEGLRVSFNKA